MPERFSLLPHTGTKLAAEVKQPTGDATRLRLPFQIGVEANGNASGARVDISNELRGPGDIVSVHPDMITRIEPSPGLRAFEPNYMPFVEFRDADFPWRYSLDTPGGTRRDPWLVLIALTSDEFSHVDRGNGPLARILVQNGEASLPDLRQSWAFAHVQANLPADGSVTTEDALNGAPTDHFARLVCPRKLEPQTGYALFLVPAYEAGRLRGLGDSGTASPFNAPAWDGSANPVELPVYRHWSFITDELEDLELLLRRLKAFRADDESEAGARKSASAADPGYYPNYSNPGASFEIQTAMRQPGKVIPAYNTDPALATLMTETLNTVIDGEGGDDDGNDPLVAFPPQGFRFKPETAVSSNRAKQREWFDATNLDLKYRHAAGRGSEIVKENQELFSHICWKQHEEIVAANEKLARLSAAKALVDRVATNRFEKLPSDVAISLAEPVQAYVKASPGDTFSQMFRAKGVPTSFASRALRRLSAKRQVSTGVGEPAKVIPAPAIPGDAAASPRAPAGAQPGVAAAVADSVIAGEGLGRSVATSLRSILGKRAFADQKRMQAKTVTVERFKSTDISGKVTDLLLKLPKAKADFTVTGRTEPETKIVNPIWRSPKVPLALADYLVETDRDALLTDTDKLPENSVTIFEENRRFIEAFMVGANHEMNNELRWREFPTHMRGTVFNRFWNRGRPADDPSGDDIADIHTWRDKLGNHFPPADQDASENLIVVIKGDVVRKLGNPIMTVNVAEGNEWKKNKGVNHEPVFFGKLGGDVAYFGFDISRQFATDPANRDRIFFVIYEAPGRLRFGLDIATQKIRETRRDLTRLAYAFPVDKLSMAARPNAPVHAIAAPPAPPPGPASWDELSWTHMRLDGASYIDFGKRLSVNGEPDYWGASKTSASVARSFWQKPVAAVLPLKRVI